MGRVMLQFSRKATFSNIRTMYALVQGSLNAHNISQTAREKLELQPLDTFLLGNNLFVAMHGESPEKMLIAWQAVFLAIYKNASPTCTHTQQETGWVLKKGGGEES